MFNCLVRVVSNRYDEAIEISPNPPGLSNVVQLTCYVNHSVAPLGSSRVGHTNLQWSILSIYMTVVLISTVAWFGIDTE